jgi:hypothetical protein
MDLQTAANLLLAVAITHTIHSNTEPLTVRLKVSRLQAYIDKKHVKEIPFKLDTRFKALGSEYGTVLIVFAIIFAIVHAVQPSPLTVIKLTIGLMIFIELVNTIVFDKYHIAIEKITKRFK